MSCLFFAVCFYSDLKEVVNSVKINSYENFPICGICRRHIVKLLCFCQCIPLSVSYFDLVNTIELCVNHDERMTPIDFGGQGHRQMLYAHLCYTFRCPFRVLYNVSNSLCIQCTCKYVHLSVAKSLTWAIPSAAFDYSLTLYNTLWRDTCHSFFMSASVFALPSL